MLLDSITNRTSLSPMKLNKYINKTKHKKVSINQNLLFNPFKDKYFKSLKLWNSRINKKNHFRMMNK